MRLPKDPMILVSYVNTQLRDFYPSLEDFCQSFDISKEDLCQQLENIEYHYDSQHNQFV